MFYFTRMLKRELVIISLVDIGKYKLMELKESQLYLPQVFSSLQSFKRFTILLALNES